MAMADPSLLDQAARVFVMIHIKVRRESKFHHQMVHAVAWPLGNGQAMVSVVDVHALRLQSALTSFIAKWRASARATPG